jgi:hypothetical protein
MAGHTDEMYGYLSHAIGQKNARHPAADGFETRDLPQFSAGAAGRV